MDERSRIQALSRCRPAFPVTPGAPSGAPTTTRHTTTSQWVYHEWERSLDAVLVLDVIFPVGRLAVIGLVLASRRVRVGRGARRALRAGSGIDGPTRAPPGVNHLG